MAESVSVELKTVLLLYKIKELKIRHPQQNSESFDIFVIIGFSLSVTIGTEQKRLENNQEIKIVILLKPQIERHYFFLLT